MKLVKIKWAFIVILALSFAALFVFPSSRNAGMVVEWSNAEYHASGGSDPVLLGLAVILLLAYVCLLQAEVDGTKQPFEGVFRRFVAFWLDFVIAMLAISPFLGILALVVEWKRTGQLGWSFQRTTYSTTDKWVTIVSVLLTFGWLLIYFVVPLLRRRPSPGACIMGYQVVPDEGTVLTKNQAIWRTSVGLIGVGTAYLAPFLGRDRKQGKFWVDRLFRTHAVKL